MTKKELKNKIVEYKEYKALQKETEAILEKLEAELKTELARQKVDELSIGGFVIRNTPFTQSRFDSKGFKIANPDLYGKFVREVIGHRFTVS